MKKVTYRNGRNTITTIYEYCYFSFEEESWYFKTSYGTLIIHTKDIINLRFA